MRRQRQIQLEPEGRAPIRFALDADLAVHPLHQLAADVQAQTGAAVAAGGRGIRLRELLEHARQQDGRDADAGVPHLEPVARPRALLVHAGDVEVDVALLRELDGVVDQVHEDLADAAGVAHDLPRGVRLEAHDQVQALFRCAVGLHHGHALHQLQQAAGALIQAHLPRLDPRDVQDVVDDVQERVAAFADHAHVVLLLGGQIHVEQQLADAQHRVHRRADLVAHVGQEVALGRAGGLRRFLGAAELLLGLPDLRDVDDDGDGPDVASLAVVEGRWRDDRGQLASAPALPGQLVGIAAAQPAPGHLLRVDGLALLGQELLHVTAEHLLALVADHAQERLVDVGEEAVLIDHGQAVVHGLHEQLLAALALAQGRFGPYPIRDVHHADEHAARRGARRGEANPQERVDLLAGQRAEDNLAAVVDAPLRGGDQHLGEGRLRFVGEHLLEALHEIALVVRLEEADGGIVHVERVDLLQGGRRKSRILAQVAAEVGHALVHQLLQGAAQLADLQLPDGDGGGLEDGAVLLLVLAQGRLASLALGDVSGDAQDEPLVPGLPCREGYLHGEGRTVAAHGRQDHHVVDRRAGLTFPEVSADVLAVTSAVLRRHERVERLAQHLLLRADEHPLGSRIEDRDQPALVDADDGVAARVDGRAQVALAGAQGLLGAAAVGHVNADGENLRVAAALRDEGPLVDLVPAMPSPAVDDLLERVRHAAALGQQLVILVEILLGLPAFRVDLQEVAPLQLIHGQTVEVRHGLVGQGDASFPVPGEDIVRDQIDDGSQVALLGRLTPLAMGPQEVPADRGRGQQVGRPEQESRRRSTAQRMPRRQGQVELSRRAGQQAQRDGRGQQARLALLESGQEDRPGEGQRHQRQEHTEAQLADDRGRGRRGEPFGCLPLTQPGGQQDAGSQQGEQGGIASQAASAPESQPAQSYQQDRRGGQAQRHLHQPRGDRNPGAQRSAALNRPWMQAHHVGQGRQHEQPAQQQHAALALQVEVGERQVEEQGRGDQQVRVDPPGQPAGELDGAGAEGPASSGQDGQQQRQQARADGRGQPAVRQPILPELASAHGLP